MIDTGIGVKSRRLQGMSGSILALGLAASLVCLAVVAEYGWKQTAGMSLLLPLLLCAIAVGVLGNTVVPWLRRLKAGQIVREDGPQAHLSKAGTPTMGGIFVVPVAVVAAWVGAGFATSTLVLGLLVMAFAAVGWLDDWQILRRKSNKGITPRTKMLLLLGASLAFCLWMALAGTATAIALPGGASLSVGWLFWPLAVFILTGCSNATNLTDGLDGLAGGMGAIAALGLASILAPDRPDLAWFCACTSGSYLGFLYHNRHPARVFMGDTGSLALGGALAGAALLGNSLWGLVLVGALFAWETLSVIVQVSYFKFTKWRTGTGQRFFKMAPFHHHLELSGWHELQVVAAFYGVQWLLVLLALAWRAL